MQSKEKKDAAMDEEDRASDHEEAEENEGEHGKLLEMIGEDTQKQAESSQKKKKRRKPESKPEMTEVGTEGELNVSKVLAHVSP